MKKFILFLFLLSSVLLTAQVVNGDTLRIDQKKVLKIWGTHSERGYAHGYLMAEQIREIALDYFLGYFFQNNVYTYNYCRNYLTANYQIDPVYEIETEAMINGMIDSGISIYSELLGRNLDYQDILLANCVVDISAMVNLNSQFQLGCSSMSSWGESTLADPLLSGELVITRNMDWSIHQTLLNNHLMIIHLPSEENETNWVSMSFPGMIGALSAINANDQGAFLNVGNNNIHLYEQDLHPILFSVRNGIEKDDYNNDGANDVQDVVDAIGDKLHLSGTITHCVSPGQGVVVECNNASGIEVRSIADNSVISGNNLVATNHFRSLYPPVYCYRYNRFADSLSVNPYVTIDRSWQIVSGAGGVSSNLHTIQYLPSLDLLKWSTAKPGYPAYTLPPTDFVISELFIPQTFSEDYQYIPVASEVIGYPNPFNPGTSISFRLNSDTQIELGIYNLKGQLIDTLYNGVLNSGTHSYYWDATDASGRKIRSGIYLYRLSTAGSNHQGKLLLLK